MYPNGNLFEEKMEVPRTGVDRKEQGRAIKRIGLDWCDQIREDKSISDQEGQREVII